MGKIIKFILVYHGIGSKDKFMQVTEDNFKKQVKYLINKGFKFFKLQKFISSKEKAVLLVFDDGLMSLLRVKYFLEEENIKYGIAVIANKLNVNCDDFLNATELKQFKNCEIYSHGFSHVNLTKCNEENLVNELTTSKKDLEKEFNKKINVFVYPMGKYNKLVLKGVKTAGYEYALSLLPFRFSEDIDKFAIPRININGYLSFLKFKLFVSRWGNYYLYLAFLKRKLLRQDYLK